jgi:formylglycine-generating enzyme required for sulfatase activity
MDATEVTQAQYAAFLSAKGSDTSGQVSTCTGNSSFQPATSGGNCSPSTFSPTTRPNHPVTCVDWCDAAAYCTWAGMRLCGKIGGGSADYKTQTDPTKSQWHNACSSSGANAYTYGNTFNPLACNGTDYGASSTIPVAQATACKAPAPPFKNIRDLSGNVWEWEDSCKSATNTCHVRGGSYTTTTPNCSRELMLARSNAQADVGFRCCN